MSGAKEIRTQIKSIGSTKKITKAMEMVAASKMRRAQERMDKARPYAEKIRNVVGHLVAGHLEYQHQYLEPREEVRAVALVLVSSDRGLCGGLNVNVFRAALQQIQEWEKQGVEVHISVIGKKASAFVKRTKAKVISEVTDIGDSPQLSELLGTVNAVMEDYESGAVDRVYVVSNSFVNTMTQRPSVEQILPIDADRIKEGAAHIGHHWDYIYEPDAKLLIDRLMDRYLESVVYQLVVENVACEQAARMVAMKSATDNAGKLIDELQLVYNKARQAAITQELSEIVGGASAV